MCPTYSAGAAIGKAGAVRRRSGRDDYTASIGRDACKPSGTRWIEPLVPGNAAAPFHPDARGMEGIAPVVAAAAA